MLSLSENYFQPLLIDVQESDDIWLANREDVAWFHVLNNLDCDPLKPLAIQYYQALYDFNQLESEKKAKTADLEPNLETKGQATLRLLDSRATESEEAHPLFPALITTNPTPNVDDAKIAPGVTPERLAGRQPKCFFAMFKAFIGISLMGRIAEPEMVFQELKSNPSFVRSCGFTLPEKHCYRQSDMASLRKLQQFDLIMTERGLWGHASVDQVKRNLESGKIHPEKILSHDTTHYDAWSSRHTVRFEDENGKVRSKSQSFTTKKCQCEDRHSCPHPWVASDEGAGTVTKAGGQMHWAHKASTLGMPNQGILLDAVAMSDAASHDSTSVVTHIARVFKLYPELQGTVKVVLDDSAADDEGLKLQVQEEFGLTLLAAINSRRRGPITQDLPRGIDHITPTGTPICGAGYPFQLIGVRKESEHFIFSAPDGENGGPVCQGCPMAEGCYRGKNGARRIQVSCDLLPWIDPKFPQSSVRFKKIMANRTVIERLHKLMKYDFGGFYLTKRGNKSFQATLDKTLLAMHLLI